MENRLKMIVQDALTELGAGDVVFAVEWPADLSHGDYAVNAALAASKTLGKPPHEIATYLAEALTRALGTDAHHIAVAGPGFVNITLSSDALTRTLTEVRRLGDRWGSNERYAGTRMLIEYSCPNPFKEMHIGHLLSTVIGESVARLSEASGAHVLRDSYGGDVGPHVAKALWALQKKGITDIASAKEISEAYERGARAYEESEQAKTDIDQLNVALYDLLAKDPSMHTSEERSLFELWSRGREAALSAFRELYEVLDTTFDYYFFESEVTPIGLRVVRDALEKGIFEESEGAVIYPGEKKGLHTLVFITSRGTPTYEAKDIGLAFYKEGRIDSDVIIIETGAEQIGHFTVFLSALAEIAPQIAAKMSHVTHGLLTLTTGKMSSRKGNVITARELLADVTQKALIRNPDPVTAQQVAVAALKYMILRSAPGGTIVFDPEKSLSLDGDSGPYLQYALVRARSILEKASLPLDTPQLPDRYVLARLITRFPQVIAKAERLRGPHVLVQYLTQLAGEWNSFYARERIIGEPDEAAKLALVHAVAITLERGLQILGIPAPERM